jgi:hypothetical protein
MIAEILLLGVNAVEKASPESNSQPSALKFCD